MNEFFNALSFNYFSKTVDNIPYQWVSKHAKKKKKEEATFLMANDSYNYVPHTEKHPTFMLAIQSSSVSFTFGSAISLKISF